MTLVEQAEKATALAKEAFASGDHVTGIASIRLAAQLLDLARIRERWDNTDTESYGP